MLVKGRWPSRLPLGDPLVGPGFLGPSYIVKVFLIQLSIYLPVDLMMVIKNIIK